MLTDFFLIKILLDNVFSRFFLTIFLQIFDSSLTEFFRQNFFDRYKFQDKFLSYNFPPIFLTEILSDNFVTGIFWQKIDYTCLLHFKTFWQKFSDFLHNFIIFLTEILLGIFYKIFFSTFFYDTHLLTHFFKTRHFWNIVSTEIHLNIFL